MATEAAHIDFANRTQSMIAHLLKDVRQHSPWIAIAAFYKALHVVEAAFANDPSILHTSNHDEREWTLKRARKYVNIYQHYSPLKRASLNARYLVETAAFDAYLSPERVVDVLLKHHLHQIEQSASKFLKVGDLVPVGDAFA